ncbi:MAG: protein kinase, partial [Pirellulales bacterium]
MKVSTQQECPDAETLAAFDSGKLAEREFKPVAEHIEVCRECQAHLEQADECSGFVALLRSAAENSNAKQFVGPAARGGHSKLVKKLLDLGVIDDAQAAITCGQQDDSKSLKQLLRAGVVTDFQARSIAKGKAAGLRLGDYIIRDKLGEGGMGLVYKAEHRRMQRTVAIKLLPASATASREAVRRFQREAQAAAKLIHRNVVTAYDAGEDQGRHFLVMEHVEGESLSSMVRSRGPLPVAKALDYVRQTASALQYAHSQGIVHRDIKPGNILVDRQGVVKLLDLGLARIGNVASEPGSDDLTRSGQTMGTVDYMAPEQARSSRTADHRADIYSLGCTWYFLLTGGPPYRGDNPVETLLAHAEQPVPSLRATR